MPRKKIVKKKSHLVKLKKQRTRRAKCPTVLTKPKKKTERVQSYITPKIKKNNKEIIGTWEEAIFLSFDYNYIFPTTPLFSLQIEEIAFWWAQWENNQTSPIYPSLFSPIKHPQKPFFLHFSLSHFPSSLKSPQPHRPLVSSRWWWIGKVDEETLDAQRRFLFSINYNDPLYTFASRVWTSSSKST